MLVTPQRPHILTILSAEQLYEKRKSRASALQARQSFCALCLETTTYDCKLNWDKYLRKRLIWLEIPWSEVSILLMYSTCFHRMGSGTFISSWGNLMSAPFSRSSMRPFLSQTWTLKPSHASALSASCVLATENCTHQRGCLQPLCQAHSLVFATAPSFCSHLCSPASPGDPRVP